MDRSGRNRAAGFSLLAAFIWASYYGFVLGLIGKVSPLALIAYPFLFGGVIYGVYAVGRGHGSAFAALFASPQQWVRVGFFLGAQIAIVAVTLTGGPVDAALLSLVGDVAMTPLLVMWIYGEGRDRLRSAAFVGGLLLSGAGASLTILDGGGVQPVTGGALVAALLLPLLVAGFFVSAARAARTVPVSAVAGQAALASGLLALPGVLLFPQGVPALAVPSGSALLLLAGAGVTSFFIAPALYFEAIRRVGILLPALLMAGIPVFTLGFAAAITGQLPGALALAGLPVAVVGALLAVEGSQISRGPPAPG